MDDDDQQKKIQEVVKNVIAKYRKARKLPTEQSEETLHPEEDKHPEDNSKVDEFNKAKENDSGSANDVFAWARGTVPISELPTLQNVPDYIKDIILEKTPTKPSSPAAPSQSKDKIIIPAAAKQPRPITGTPFNDKKREQPQVVDRTSVGTRMHPEEDKHPEDNSKADNSKVDEFNKAKENDSGSANDVFAWARGTVPISELPTLQNVPDYIKDIILEKTPTKPSSPAAPSQSKDKIIIPAAAKQPMPITGTPFSDKKREQPQVVGRTSVGTRMNQPQPTKAATSKSDARTTLTLTKPPAVDSGQPERSAQQEVTDAAPRRPSNQVMHAVDRRRGPFQKVGGTAGHHTSEKDSIEAIERKAHCSNPSTARNRPVVQAYGGKLLNDKEKAEALGDSPFEFPDKPVEVYSYKDSNDPKDPTGNIATNCVEEMDEALETD